MLVSNSGTSSKGSDGSYRRLLVPVGWLAPQGDSLTLAIQIARVVRSPLRLVHVRIWDPPVRGCGRFYLETSEEATAVLERALERAWACGVDASGVVVDAERSRVAAAILAEAASWSADSIILTR